MSLPFPQTAAQVVGDSLRSQWFENEDDSHEKAHEPLIDRARHAFFSPTRVHDILNLTCYTYIVGRFFKSV